MSYKFLLAICVYLPFQLAISPTPEIDLASIRILIILLFFSWILEGLKNKKLILPAKIPLLLVFSFLFFCALSLAVSKNINWSFRKLAFLFSIFPLYFIASALIKNGSEYKKIIKLLVWGAGLSAIIGLVQFIIQFVAGLDYSMKLWSLVIRPFLGTAFSQAVMDNPSWLVNLSGKTVFRAVSLFPDPHMFSFYLGMVIPWSIALYFEEKKKLYALIFIVLLAADFLTFSRGGYLGLMAGIIFWLLFSGKKIIAAHKKKFAFGLIILFLIIFTKNPVSRRLVSSFDLGEGSNQGRLETWKQSFEVIRKNPLLGVGLGNYPLEIKPSADYREPIYSHNLYLDIAAETGILNAVIFIALLLSAIISFIKKSAQNNFFMAGAVSLAIFSAHSFFETPLFSVHILPLFLIIISLSDNNQKIKNI